MQTIIKGSIVSVLILISSHHTIQANDFTANLVSTYTITSNDFVAVNQILTITNQTDLRFPTGYEYTIQSNNLDDLKITNQSNQPTKYESTPNGNKTTVQLQFPEAIVGKGKSQTYIFNYKTNDFILSNSGPLQVSIPENSKSSNYTETIQVIIPNTICKEIVTSIPSQFVHHENDLKRISYTNNDSIQPLFVRCANNRYLEIEGTYSLQNQNMTPIETQIALPPDTAYQQWIFDEINPQPLSTSLDHDGNMIATFKLEPKEKKQIQLKARVMVSATPNQTFAHNSVDKTYLNEKAHWPTHDSEIKKLAQKLGNTQEIYKYIINETNYQNESVDGSQKRLGGITILSDDKNLSSNDYVDSFITLSRSMGIMSRRLIGIGISSDKSIRPNSGPNQLLHTWVDYYDSDSNAWVQIDPIWEKTSSTNYFPISDLNHIVLAINGSNDSSPYALDTYQFTDIDQFDFPIPTIEATISQTTLDIIRLNQHQNLIIKNNSYHGLYNQKFDIVANEKIITSFEVNRLPPQSQVIIPINIQDNNENLNLKNQYLDIKIKTSDQHFTSPIIIAGILVILSCCIAIITRRLLVSR